MIIPKDLIESINKSFRTFIGNSFRLGLSKQNSLNYVVEGTSKALSRFPNDFKEVNVIKWFDKFWLYLEVKFSCHDIKVNRKLQPQVNTNISLSIFQGEDDDEEKNQLLRAEWDDYNNLNEKHAQPHWHITSSQSIESTFEKYADTFEKQDFIELLESEKQKVFDVKKIHFAMNADWQTNGTHLHKIEDEQQIVNWLQGMLSYLRFELEN